jgi:hypothetical protein
LVVTGFDHAPLLDHVLLLGQVLLLLKLQDEGRGLFLSCLFMQFSLSFNRNSKVNMLNVLIDKRFDQRSRIRHRSQMALGRDASATHRPRDELLQVLLGGVHGRGLLWLRSLLQVRREVTVLDVHQPQLGLQLRGLGLVLHEVGYLYVRHLVDSIFVWEC